MAKGLKWNVTVKDTSGNSIGTDKCIVIGMNYNKTSTGYTVYDISTNLTSGGYITGNGGNGWWNLYSSSYPYVCFIIALNNDDYVCNASDQNSVYKTLNFANGSSTIDEYLWNKIVTYSIGNVKHADLTGYETYVSSYYNPIYFVEASSFFGSATYNDTVTINIVLSTGTSPTPSTDPEVSYTIGSVGNLNGNVSVSPESPFTVGSDGVTMVVTPNSGYSFTSSDYVSIDADTSYDFTLQTDGTMTYTMSQSIAKTLTSGFVINGSITKDVITVSVPFTISGNNANVNQTSPMTVGENGVVFNVTPNDDYYFSDDDTCKATYGSNEISFTKSANIYTHTFTLTEASTISSSGGNLTISWTVSKKETSVSLTFTINGNNASINQTSPITVYSSSSAMFKVTPNNGWYFSDSDTCKASWSGGSVNFNKVDNYYTYTFSYNEAYIMANAGDVVISWTITQKEDTSERLNFYTVFLPTKENMKTIADAVFIEDSSVVDAIQYFLSYKQFSCNIEPSGYSVLHAGRYKFGEDSPYTDKTTIELDCGIVEVKEKYNSLVDYTSSLTIYLPFIGFEDLNTDYFMGYSMKLIYVIDVVTGKCLAKVLTNCFGDFQCVAEYSGYVARDEPISDNVGNNSGSYALLTTYQIGDIIPYLLITRNIPIESDIGNYSGYPSNEIIKVKDATGFIKFNSIRVNGLNCTDSEKDEIKSLLLNGVIVN